MTAWSKSFWRVKSPDLLPGAAFCFSRLFLFPAPIQMTVAWPFYPGHFRTSWLGGNKSYYSRNISGVQVSFIIHCSLCVCIGLLPFFGKLQVDKTDAVTVRKWQNEMMSAINPHNGKKYAPTYLRTVNSRLSAIFNYAVMYTTSATATQPCWWSWGIPSWP